MKETFIVKADGADYIFLLPMEYEIALCVVCFSWHIGSHCIAFSMKVHLFLVYIQNLSQLTKIYFLFKHF